MATIQDTIKELAEGGKNVAGYIKKETAIGGTKNVFHYVVSTTPHLPAVAYVIDTAKPKKEKIYTNLPQDHWIYTYTNRQVKLVGSDTTTESINETKAIPTPKLSLVAGQRPVAPIPGGGLFAAAMRLNASDVSTSTGKAKGIERALRYYMLAGYSLLGICAEESYGEGNFIAAMMVNDEGQILSFGVNSGFFHHGEVNMLLNYFSKVGNKAKQYFDEQTVVFSTLTPCKQCADYLESCRPPDGKAVIYIGQEDTGEFGKEGAKYAVFLDEVTKPPMIRKIQKDALSKVAAHLYLESQITSGEGTVAKQIGLKCKDALLQAANTLARKIGKDRDGTGDPEEQAVKHAVLTYLGMWLGTVSLTRFTVS